MNAATATPMPNTSGWHFYRPPNGTVRKVYVGRRMHRRMLTLCTDGVPLDRLPGEWFGPADLRHG